MIEETILLLQQSQSSDAVAQRLVNFKVSEWSHLDEFNYALACIFSNAESSDETTRSLAGIILKNNVKSNYHSFEQELKEFVKKQSLSLLRDPSATIRSTATSLIATIAGCGEFVTWQELLPTLTQLIVSSENYVAESAFGALDKICEDLAEMLCHSELSSTLDQMLPGFIKLLMHHNPKIRNYALTCLNYFVPLQANAIMNNIDEFIKALFQLANDTDTDVRKNVCRSLVALYETRPEVLDPYLNDVILYMKNSSKDTDAQVALDACEFWLSVPENPLGRDLLVKHLPDLIPFFMEKMRYSEEDIELMQAEINEDCMVPDKDEDIRPQFHKSKNTIGSSAFGDDPRAALDIEDDDEDDDFDASATWNIRKCAAAALDCMAHQYTNEILPLVIPVLEKTITSQNWIVKEAAILSLGAIAEGCLTGLSPNLPSLIPYLIDSLKDKQPLVRVITCWTLGRYSSWISTCPSERYFNQVLNGLLFCILDNNKRVQEAACSAFATLAEGANSELALYLDNVLSVLVQAFDKYQHKNLLHLYDAIGTFATAVKHNLNQPRYIEILIPPIIKKWNSLSDVDQDLFPLLECLSSIAVALGDGFKPYIEGVFKRCLSLVEQCLQQENAFHVDPMNNELPNKDFMIAALDLISGLAEGSKESITDLIASSNIIQLSQKTMFDSLPEVRQSSFALIGDLTKACFHLIKPHTPNIMKALSENVECTEHVSVCNNATWAVGEMAIKLGLEMRQFVHMFINPLLKNINQPNIPRTLLDNTAISLGRLSLACPEELAPHLKQFIKPWCISVRSIRDNDAKDSAFRGICQLIQKNSLGIVEDFILFCDAIACWDDPHPDLKRIFYELLHSFKNHLGDRWEQYRELFEPGLKQKLAQNYRI